MVRSSPLALVFLALMLLAAPAGAEPTRVWSDLFDGGGHYTDLATAAFTDAAGNLYVGGESADGVQGSDMSIRWIDRATGITIWETRYSAFDGNDMALSALEGDGFGNIIVAGYIRGCAT
jgi:hypothetical protein